MSDRVTILGVDFFPGTAQEAVSKVLSGGLLVAPSGPGLAGSLIEDPAYAQALESADVVLPDSGLMILLWNSLARRKSPRLDRVSGLEFLECFLKDPEARLRLADSFWVMPSEKEKQSNLQWLSADLQLNIPEASTYVAPMYPGSGPVEDVKLLESVQSSQPAVVFLNIGGGVQERIGHYLQQNLDPCPAIICCGAAIAFLAGGQARIPAWADRCKLGWLLRCLHKPSSFIPRYWKAKSLVPLLLRYRDRRPPILKPTSQS